LLVFLMASIVAIMLYMELPRAAMQAQRDKEEMLIDRGEQYKRAIQLFVNKARRYPAEIKDLENFNNQRFLRQRYADPMTGKDEWRLIHIQNGMLTDSKVTKPNGPGGQDQAKNPNGFVGEQVGLGGPQNQGGQGGGAANVRDRRRPSEGANASFPGTTPGQGPAGVDPSGGQNPLPGQGPDGQPLPGTTTGQPGQPIYPPGASIPGQPGNPGMPGQPGQPGQPTYPGQPGQPGQPTYPGVPGQPGQPTYPGMPGQPGQPTYPGMPGGPGNPIVTQPGTSSNAGNTSVGGGGGFVGGGGSFVGSGSQPTNPSNPGQPMPGQGGPGGPTYPSQPGPNGMPQGFPQPGGTTTGQGNAAADMIRNILTTPRPGGMPQQGMGGQTFGGGIAGVASTAEGEGVKVYNERTLYQEWEFIFDPSKQKQIPNPNALGAIGTPASSMGSPMPGQQHGAPGMSPPVSPQTGH
jgi:integrin beta 8